MANLTASTVNGVSVYTGTYELTQQSGTSLQFNTAGKYVDRNIIFQPTVKTTSVTSSTSSTAANNKVTWGNGWVTANTISAGAVSLTGNKNATIPTINTVSVTISGATRLSSINATTTAPSSGYFVSLKATAPETTITPTPTVTTGYLGHAAQVTGSVKTNTTASVTYYIGLDAAALQLGGGALSNKTTSAAFTNASTSSSDTSGVQIVTSAGVTRNAITCTNNTAGWLPTINTTMAAVTDSWSTNTYYLTGVVLTNNKTFNITIPNGTEGNLTLHFSVDNNGNTTIT